MQSKTNFTIAICTFNGAQRLPALINKLLYLSQHSIQLANQQNLNLEIIIVDNNSTDNTAKVIKTYQQKFPTNQFKYIFESQQGVAYARRRAIQEAKGEIIGFLDDDNIPEDNWIAAAYQFFQQHPQAAACGSSIQGVYEIAPPPNFERIASLMAIINRGEKAFITQRVIARQEQESQSGKQAWVDCVPRTPKILGRTANSIASKGEEIEALLYMQAGGWEIWHNPQMKLLHHISSDRFQPEYLTQLCRSVGLSRFQTRTITLQNWQKPPAAIAHFLNDLRKTFKHIIKYRDSLKNDLVTRCELELLIASLFSPFYHAKLYFRKNFR
ncbi:MAG: glycosyltransferase family 2 protein [Calothrix sp. CSU_2_0]|nr:glycosyltransferase family 2 protein [Calothrix sp. CSU_2_0]